MTMGDYFLIVIVLLLVFLVVWKRAAIASAWLGLQKFGQETKVEMQKVSWPTRNEAIGSTIVVLVAVLFLTLYVTVADQLLTFVLDFVLKSKGA